MTMPASRNSHVCSAARASRNARAITRERCWRRRPGGPGSRRPGGLLRLRTVGAVLAHAAAVQGECVIGDLEAEALGDLLLPVFDAVVRELFHAPAVDAHDVVVMRPLVQLEDGRAALEVV